MGSVLEAARALFPAIVDGALEAEVAGAVPDHVMDAGADAGLFRLAMPAVLGGLEVDPMLFVEVIEEVSRADGSTGWAFAIGNSTAFLAWLQPDVAKELLAEAGINRPMASMFAPLGRAVDRGNGSLSVSGRWPFNSGSPHASVFINGLFVMDGGDPRLVNGRPDWRFAMFPRSAVEVLDTWHVAGLRATGSHDVVVAEVAIPVERTISPLFDPAVADGALYRMSFFNLATIMLLGFPLGVARRALDEFSSIAPVKSRGPNPPLGEDGHVRLAFTQAEGSVRAARAYAFDAVHRAWDLAQAGDPRAWDVRADVMLAALNATRACQDAVDTVFHLAGGGALHDSSPLQRCWRDIHAGGQHILFSFESWKRVGGVLLAGDRPISGL